MALAARVAMDMRYARPIEYFGASAVDYNETPIDNRQAFLDAFDWSADTGGMILLGAGTYGVDGSLPLRSHVNLTGLDRDHSIIRQLTVGQDVLTSSDGPGESIARCHISRLRIDGGWQPSWGAWLADKTNDTAAGIRLVGRFAGPDDPAALTREDTQFMADPYHVIFECEIKGIQGSGIVTDGRGEMQILNNRIGDCSLYGMILDAPDCWFANNTVRITGDSGVLCRSGNQRFSNEKYWFCGMRRDAEGVCAGLEISGAAVANVVGSNLTTQDTWGPGLVLDGDAPIIDGNIDEAGGGRIDDQSFGYRTYTDGQGVEHVRNRTLPRCNIRLAGSVRNARVRMSARGGALADALPHLVHLEGSGVEGNEIELNAEGLSIHETPIVTSSAHINSRRHNIVELNGEMLHGALTPTDIADATHPVNANAYKKTMVHLTDGTLAVRDGANWRVFSGSTVTPA
jgi:hypothetical protein